MRDLWKHLTTTVGLVVSGQPEDLNIMSAEWIYFVSKDPPYLAVNVSVRAATRNLIRRQREFCVTLCAETQAEIADFAGSFSAREIDKLSSLAIDLRPPIAGQTPWAAGGLAAFECGLRHEVALPGYLLLIGEVVAVHTGTGRPLVKHDRMHALGDQLSRAAVIAGAQVIWPEQGQPILRVAATGHGGIAADRWRITLVAPDGSTIFLGEHGSGGNGDLLVDLQMPLGVEPSSCRVLVECEGLRAGWASPSGRAAAIRGQQEAWNP
jgi:flavin reductase (DIM6/NTAB) family NADH-FMN oxidoreductase RutF